MTKSERAAEVCPQCKAGIATYFWQGAHTHRIYKKLNDDTIRFSHTSCLADSIWKEIENE